LRSIALASPVEHKKNTNIILLSMIQVPFILIMEQVLAFGVDLPRKFIPNT
jgi:hypothetical protein